MFIQHGVLNQLTYHIDELRNRLTSFFLTFTGIAVAGLVVLLKGEASKSIFKNPELIISILLLIIAIIGVAVVCILARLRKVQIEHFRIINNIRQYFFQFDYLMWNTVQLSNKTLPTPSRRSGTYYWLFIIMFVSSLLFATAAYLFVTHIINNEWGISFFIATSIIVFLLLDVLYFYMAMPPPILNYSENSPPIYNADME